MSPIAFCSWLGSKARGHAWWRGRYHLPLAEAVRGGVVCAVPAVLAAQLHNPLLCWSAIAAFWTVLADPTDAGLRRRFVAGIMFGIFGALGALCAIASSSIPFLTIALTGAIVFLGGLLRSRGADVGLHGLLAATTFAVAAAFPVHGIHAATNYAVYFMVGNLWAVACGVAMWRTSKTGPVRRAAFIYFAGMADFVNRLAIEAAEPRTSWIRGANGAGHGRAPLRAKLEALHASIGHAGGSCPSAVSDWAALGERGMALIVGLQSLFGRDLGQSEQEAVRLLSPVLAQLGNLVEEWALGIRTDANGTPQTTGRQRQDLNREIRLCRRLFQRLVPDAASHEFVTTCLSLVTQLESLIAGPRIVRTSLRAPPQVAAAAPAMAAWRQLVRDLCSEANPGSAFARHAARLSVGAMIAVAIAMHFPLRQGYWIVLTSLFVVQPNFAQTLKVSTLRVGGTILGATLASALGLVFHSPLLLALAILPLAAGSLAAKSVNYVSYILFLTPHFILVAHLGLPTGAPWELAIWRIANSAVGALLAIAIAFILWPHWERDRLARSASRAVDGAAAYLSAALRRLGDDACQAGSSLAELRREACLAIDEIEAILARMKLEPFPQSRRMACGTIALTSLRRLTGAASLLESTKGGALTSHDAARLNELAEWAIVKLRDKLSRLKSGTRSSPFERQRWVRKVGACRSYPAGYVEQEVTSAFSTLHTVMRGLA